MIKAKHLVYENFAKLFWNIFVSVAVLRFCRVTEEDLKWIKMSYDHTSTAAGFLQCSNIFCSSKSYEIEGQLASCSALPVHSYRLVG